MDFPHTVWSCAVLSVFILISHASTIIDCPHDWDEFDSNCYHFVFYPTQDMDSATDSCQHDGAGLLSVNTDREHHFISDWLARHDFNKATMWFTSGVGNSSTLTWQGDGHVGYLGQEPWVDEDAAYNVHDVVVYRYSLQNNTFVWDRARRSQPFSYICEIAKLEAFRITRPVRDYSYGSNTADPGLIRKGPKFTVNPTSVIIAGRMTSTYLECAASGYPLPAYKWFKLNTSGSIEVTSQSDGRYTITNGKLTISDVSSKLDPGDYQCVAENPSGSIIGDLVHISHGYLKEFSNDRRGFVRAPLYQGTVINCNPLAYNPAVTFQWYKGDAQHFIRPVLNAYQFISNNGKLYFSETQQLDAGVYFCVVTLTAPSGEHWRLATAQPPSRTSLGMELKIDGEAATDFGPNIHDDFPAVFPNPPLRGENLRVECLAYGRLPLHYSWSRDKGLPARAVLTNHNRVLTIENVQEQDSGSYSCNVRRSGSPLATKSIFVSVQATPYFIMPLQNQFIDIGTELLWRCQANAVPPPQYTWYKNTRRLLPVPGEVEMMGNVLKISKANPSRHDGMYQCSAINMHGKSFSSAELRVLSFKPMFVKNPVKDTLATVGGNATMFCRPEAAPVPELTWFKNGGEIGLRPGDLGGGRLQFLRNGNLHISAVSRGDAGTYRCVATNSQGSTSSEGELSISEQTTLTVTPSDTTVVVNETSFLFCDASYNTNNDLAYVWRFNGYVIDVDNHPHYVKGVHGGQRGLYVRYAQFSHEGRYECEAITGRDRVTAAAHLTVKGPPGEPGGVFGEIQQYDVTLRWTDGSDRNSPILYYVIEYCTNFNPAWRVVVQILPAGEATDPVETSRRQTEVVALRPGTIYRFRVKAANIYGIGEPSLASIFYKTPDAAPASAPVLVGGGGGKVGTLKITWQILSREDEGGAGIGYRVFWREKHRSSGRWRKKDNRGRAGQHVAVVGMEKYYLEYEVKVAAFNDLGFGPNSTVIVIFSAEDLPYAAPHNIQAETYNATGISVTWDPIQDVRAVVKGRVRGFLITWWFWQNVNTKRYKSYHYGANNTVVVIGLPPNEFFWVKVQMFNGAGLGPESQPYYVETAGEGPLHYPEYVNIRSHGADSVYVSWRGVSTGLDEEALIGYKLRYWKTDEDLYQARDVTVDDKKTHGVISGLEKDYIYTLRMVGYGLGGDGKKAPPVYFTLGGMIRYDKTSTAIMAAANQKLPCIMSLILCTAFGILVSTL